MNSRFSYGAWDTTLPALPQRCRLYNLEPIGVGTTHTESFTSYIARLAGEHDLSTGTLFTYELAPMSDKQYLLLQPSSKRTSVLSSSFSPATPSLNGMGSTAEDWVKVLEKLTSRRELRYLTVLTWQNLAAETLFTRPFRAWCPACLNEQQNRGGVIYEHLLWSLKIASVCPQHQQLLETKCPHCEIILRPLADRSKPGYCSRCSRALWYSKSGNTSDIESSDKSKLAYQAWVARQIGQLIAVGPNFLVPPPKEVMIENLLACIQQTADGNICLFSRIFEVHKETVYSWRLHNSIPRTDLLLKICYRLDMSLLDFLTKKDAFADSGCVGNFFKEKTQDGHKVFRRRREEVEQALQAALQEDHPPSLPELAERLGYSSTAGFSKYHPELCKKITARYHASERYKRKKPRPIMHEVIALKHALENALKERETPSLTSIAKKFGYSSAERLSRRFPELCELIKKRRSKQKTAYEDKIYSTLQAALIENPPPTLMKVSLRLGLKSNASIWCRYPDVCRAIASRSTEHRRFQFQQIRHVLQAMLSEDTPPTLRAAARRIGYDSAYLGVHFPPLCQAIAKRHAEFRKQCSLEKKREAKEEVNDVAFRLHTNGIYPSVKCIKQRMSKSGVLTPTELCSAVREAKRELALL